MIPEVFETLVDTRFGIIPNGKLTPCRQHQMWDELRLKEKELANEIYIQRCKERDL